MHTTAKILLILFLAVACPLSVHAAEYYVDGANSAASDSNAGTANAPWKTISRANQALTAGDTVYIKAGTYANYIAPVNSGSPSYPITYRNYGTDTVTVTNASYGIYLDGKSYINVQGITFTYLDQFLWLQNSANHNTISYCTFDRARTVGWSGSKIYRNSSYNHVHHCSFSNYGKYTTDDIGTVIDIGNENVSTDYADYNLLENNTFYHGGHHVMGIFGMYNVIRNNYFHNENWQNGYGDRVVYLNGYAATSGRNLIEGNRIGYSGIPPDNWGGAGMSMATSYNIVRFNAFYHNNLSGITMTTLSTYPSAPTYNRIYNNSFMHNGFNSDPSGGRELKSGVGFARYSGNPIVKNALKNNIFRYNGIGGSYGAYNVSLTDQIIAGNWEDSGDPQFVSASTVLGDPMNADLPDLHLISGSPCIDAGVPLAKIVSASGSGTSFQVDDAGYFMDGWGIVAGDTIRLSGSAQQAVVTHVDYGTNTLTVGSSLTWTQNQGVGMAYSGKAPDQGAYEYQQTATAKQPSPPRNLRVQ